MDAILILANLFFLVVVSARCRNGRRTLFGLLLVVAESRSFRLMLPVAHFRARVSMGATAGKVGKLNWSDASLEKNDDDA